LELKKERTSFFQRSNIDRKFEILDRIVKIGRSADISDLVPLAEHKHKMLREKTVETIEVLLQKMKTKNHTYNSLRYCNITSKNLDTYQNIYKKKHLTQLLIIASMNKSGYVREKAIRKFNRYRNPEVIPYLLFRLGDWVKQVRETAKTALDDFLNIEYFDEFIEQLSTIEWLLKVKRVNLEIEHKKILDFLTIENIDHLLQVFPKQQEKNRLILTKYILKREKVDTRIIQTLLKDKNFLIRKLVADNLEKLYSHDLKEALLKDKNNKVRLNTLYNLIKLNKITTEEWKPFLIDKSFWVRDLARFELKGENIDFIAFYRKHIEQESFLNIAILGLGEVEQTKDIAFLQQYLYHENDFVRQSAAMSILKMEEYAIDNYLIQKLASDDNRVKKIAIKHFSKYPDNETLDKIRNIYDQGNSNAKISVLKLFSKIRSNRVYPDLLKGVEEENFDVKEIASKYLNSWNRNSSYKVFD